MPVDRSLLSVVVPIFNEEANLPELASRLMGAFEGLNFRDYEVIFVSDGSKDRSEEIITGLARCSHVFKGVFLTRNFGHQAAVSTGLAHASGSVVCVLDGDLQDPPEVIAQFVAALDQGADVAYAVRQRRKEHLLKRAAYHAFYRLLRGVASIDIPLDSGDFCCMTRRVVDDMLALPERNRFVRGLRAWVGYKQVGVLYERSARFAGQTKYSLRKLVALAYDGIFSFSNLPVKLMQLLGFVTSALAFVTAIGYLAWYCVSPSQFPAGWATLVISIWFIGGTQLLFMGLLGEYVFRTFDEARRRPAALVRSRLNQAIAREQEEIVCDPITPRLTPSFIANTGGGASAKTSSWIKSAA